MKPDQPHHKNFFMLPNRIFDLHLKPREFTVLCCLLRHCDNEKRSAFPSRRLIASECCIDRKTVDAALKALSSCGLIKTVSRRRTDGAQTSNLYYVKDLFKTERDSLPDGVISP